MKRLFIAVLVDDKWRKTFETYQQETLIEGSKWEQSATLSIPILQLGAVKEDIIPEIEDALRDICSVQKSFRLSLLKIDYDREKQRPSVVSVYWTTDPVWNTLTARGREELSYLVSGIDLSPLAPVTELAHFDKKTHKPEELPVLPRIANHNDALEVKSLCLFESVMTPTGIVDKLRSSFVFGESNFAEE